MDYHTSLLTATDARGHVHLVVGANPLAAARCTQSLAVGATPILVAPAPVAPGQLLPAALQVRVDAGEVHWVRAVCDVDAHVMELGRGAVDGVVDAVFVADHPDAASLAAACRRRRVPVNVVDRPDLCTFALLSTHVDGPLQIGITTNGSGCKLAARIRREVVAALPADLGAACARLGALRRRIQAEDRLRLEKGRQRAAQGPEKPAQALLSEDDSYDQTAAFNRLVLTSTTNGDTTSAGTTSASNNNNNNDDDDSSAETAKTRRMRWLAQMCEYWPLKRLAGVTDADVEALLAAYGQGATTLAEKTPSAQHAASLTTPSRSTGRIILAGSGPGHPDLLTRAVHRAILAADLVLADKLVPQGVLDLIPRRTPVVIARKFPCNADAAQEELLEQATAAAADAGKTVLRLKQGDPFVYGRGGEEVLRLRAAGFVDGQTLFVLPGVTSALSAPLFAGVPATHRDAADQVLICTGTGKRGKPPQPPGYRAPRTAVFLMALHRISGLVAELTAPTAAEDEAAAASSENRTPLKRALWPMSTPCTVIERASCPDQRVIRTTLEHVAAAIEQEGSRPPGLLVVGRACEVLHAPTRTGAEGEVAGPPWTVEEGFSGLDIDSLSAAELASRA